MAKAQTKKIDGIRPSSKGNPSFEDALARLEQIVEQLDDGELPLATSLELFKEGRALATHCRGLLEQAELEVKTALGDSSPPTPLDEDDTEDLVEDEEDGA